VIEHDRHPDESEDEVKERERTMQLSY
jgi:hypothetical protein